MSAQAAGPNFVSRSQVETVARMRDQFGPDPGWVSMTRHSWRLATRSFELDYTWSRQEGGAALAEPSPSIAPAAQTAVRSNAARPLPSFAEVLRRQQLAALLMMPSRPPADRTPLPRTDQRLPALPGQVSRAYAQAQGPLAAPASCCFSA